MFLLCCSVTMLAQKRLTILHTNDTHSCVMPLSPHLADTLQAGRGGFLRRVAMRKEERAKDPSLLLFDSGDFSQGSPYYTLFKGDVEVGLMNMMRYDAVTIGNHEFDFGLENMARLFKKLNCPVVCANYRFHEYDLDKIVELGFNCVRVPFWFRNFYYDDKGTKILDKNGEWDFSRLDWVVSECSKRGLYVILDLHGAPGYQNNKDHCGKIGDSGLFKLTKQAEEWRKLTIELWVAIAERFSGNPAVAMYDLLNEPNCDVSSYLQKNNLVTISVYNRLYKAIREVDKDHIMTMEGIWRLYNLPAPWFIGWTNVVYQLHFYDTSNFMYSLLVFFAKLYPYNVPLYVGEFKPMGSATWDHVLTLFKNSNFSWTIWSYKGCGHGADTSDWYIIGSKPGFERADIKNDDFDTIARKWGAAVRSEGNYVDTGLYDIVKDYI